MRKLAAIFFILLSGTAHAELNAVGPTGRFMPLPQVARKVTGQEQVVSAPAKFFPIRDSNYAPPMHVVGRNQEVVVPTDVLKPATAATKGQLSEDQAQQILSIFNESK